MIKNTKQEPKNKGHFARYLQIVMVLAKYRLEEVLRYVGMQKYSPFQWVLCGNPWRKMAYTKPEGVRMALEELGTTFVKLGQILSTRADLLPPDYTKELSKLQSSLKPIPLEVMKKVMGRSINEVFSSYDLRHVKNIDGLARDGLRRGMIQTEISADKVAKQLPLGATYRLLIQLLNFWNGRHF